MSLFEVKSSCSPYLAYLGHVLSHQSARACVFCAFLDFVGEWSGCVWREERGGKGLCSCFSSFFSLFLRDRLGGLSRLGDYLVCCGPLVILLSSYSDDRHGELHVMIYYCALNGLLTFLMVFYMTLRE